MVNTPQGELTKDQTEITKGIAILFMVALHLFCTRDYEGVYSPLIYVGSVPLSYYIGLFGDCCVAIFLFCSGYGLFISWEKNASGYFRSNLIRILKLYVNYWIILLIFCVGIGFATQKAGYPGDLSKFLLNFIAFDCTYNGAWWFLFTYIMLVLLSGRIFRLVRTIKPIWIFLPLLLLYCVTYVLRLKYGNSTDPSFFVRCFQRVNMIGNSALSFVAGAVFFKEKWISRYRFFLNKNRFSNLYHITGILFLVVFHAFFQTLFLAVFNGIAFIVLFNGIRLGERLKQGLLFVSSHSTNIWLVHMFFYMIFFRSLVLLPEIPILVFIWLLILCIGTSYCIRMVYHPVVNWIDAKLNQKT